MDKDLRTKSLIAGLVGVATFLVFLPSLRNEFLIWDDNLYVYENPFIRSFDTKLLKSAFCRFNTANWHPLTWLSHALDYALWGLNPLGHHLTNNILHALNAAIVIFLIIELIEAYRRTGENNGLLSDRAVRITVIATGLLFGLHPLHVESVAWVAERKDLLCAFFFLLAIIAYTHYVKEINANTSTRFFNKKYFLAIGFFTLSLLSKPMAVTLPLVLLLLDWCAFGRIQSLKTFRAAFIEKLPFILLALISSVLTLLAQETGGAIKPMEVVPLASRLIVAAGSIISYLIKIVVPVNLVPFYPYPKDISLFSPEHIIPAVLVPGITIACISVMRKQKFWIAVWSYYVITLVPVLGIVQVGEQSMADRYTYLPSLGPFLVIGILAAKVYEKVTALNRWRRAARIIAFCIVVAILAAISYATIRQIGIWRSNIVFWTYVIESEPSGVPVAHNNLGNAYLSMGRSDMAIEQYRTVLSLKPYDVYAHYNLGIAYASKGQFDMAIEQYRTALSLKPDDADAHNNLGNAFLSMGRLDTAIAQYRTALSLKPDDAKAHNNLGNAYASKGQFDMAIAQYRTALSLKPDFVEAYYDLGLIYLKNGSTDKARAEFEAVLKIKPDDYGARQMLDSIASK